MSTKTYQVRGMTCNHCVHAVTTEVGLVPGVQDVTVELDGGKVTVTGEGVDDAAVADAVAEAGYELVA